VFQAVREKAVALANEVEDKEICPENMPPSLAAGVIALVLQQENLIEEAVSYERIATVCGVSDGTLQKCLKKLEGAVSAGLLKGI
jgi:hypothetical protein